MSEIIKNRVEKVMETALENAINDFLIEGGVIPKLYLIGPPNQKVIELPMPFQNTDEKHKMFAAANMLLRTGLDQGLRGAIFASESWLVEIEQGDSIDIEVRAHPNRIEVIIISAEWKGGHKVICKKIKRNDNGVTELIEMDLNYGTMDTAMFEGVFK